MDEATRALALKAHRLSLKGIRGKELAAKLKLTTAPAGAAITGVAGGRANDLARLGGHIAFVEAAVLTESERLVLLALADLTRDGGRGVKSKQVSWRAGRLAKRYPTFSDGWCGTVVKRRIKSRDHDESYEVPRWGLVDHSHNGHIWLTEVGWAFVHALESTTSRGGHDGSESECGTSATSKRAAGRTGAEAADA